MSGSRALQNMLLRARSLRRSYPELVNKVNPVRTLVRDGRPVSPLGLRILQKLSPGSSAESLVTADGRPGSGGIPTSTQPLVLDQSASRPSEGANGEIQSASGDPGSLAVDNAGTHDADRLEYG